MRTLVLKSKLGITEWPISYLEEVRNLNLEEVSDPVWENDGFSHKT